MIRTFAGLAIAWLALQLAELAKRMLPKRPVPSRIDGPVPEYERRPLYAEPPPATLVPPAFDTRRIPERYVRELVHIELVRADALLCLVLGNGPVYFDGNIFSKVGDGRWRQ